MKYAIIIFSSVLFMSLLSCSTTHKATVDKEKNEVLIEETTEEQYSSLQIQHMDLTVSPREDFYRYVNGGWLERTEIPDDKGRWGSFDALRKRTTNNVLTIMSTSTLDDFEEGSDQWKAFAFYKIAMDTTLANQNGVKPIQDILARVESVNDVGSLQEFIESTEKIGLRAFFGFGVGPDARNSEKYATYLGNGSLGLPDKDYYVKDDDESLRIKADYQNHIARMLPYIGYTTEDAFTASKVIVSLETALAEPRMDKVQRRNPLLRYNKRSMGQMQEILPSINWSSYFINIGVGEIDTVIVSEPKYLSSLAAVFETFTANQWKHYLRWTILNRYASRLSTDIDNTNFDFYGRKLRGLEAQRPREERMIDVCNRVLGEALGKLYVDEYFPAEAKDVASKMVENILFAFENRINNLEWMTEETKKKALVKLSTFKVKIGYPDQWKDYSRMKFMTKKDGGNYAQNIMNAREYNYNIGLSRIGQEVDKNEWYMAPQVVNAYYNPLQNEIVFPAAILQEPFYDYRADAAINYGGIGAVIGHEISHGFDDQGSRFDAEGNMNNWWTDKDRKAFDERNKDLIAQFDAYEPLPGINVNGAFTLGENIGDLGGLNVAFDALQNELKKTGDVEKIDGMTPNERFFISWGTIWRTKYRDEALKTQIKTNPHSPGMYRAIGPLSNFDMFYKTFNIQEGDPSFKAKSERVRIW